MRNFFKISDVIGLLAMMTGTSRELAIAHRPQFPAQREARHRQAELIPDPLRQIDEPPADNAMGGGDRASLNLLGQAGALLVVQDRSLARCFARRQSLRAAR